MATETTELDKDAFMRLVTEEHLQVEGPSGGYLYTGRRGKNGWELFKTANNPWYLYQARRVATQANVGGGAVIVDIALGAGQVGWIELSTFTNSGTNGLFVDVLDEDNMIVGRLAGIASAAGNALRVPSIGTAASASLNVNESVRRYLGPGMKWSIYQTGAGAQNDTLTVAVTLFLSTNTEPTWDKSRSTNAADVTLAASTISVANTMQLVPMP